MKKLVTEAHVKDLVKDWYANRHGWSYAPIQNGLGEHGIHDRVGGVPIVVTPAMVGKRICISTTVECKKPGRRGEQDRGMSKHQVMFMERVVAAGGFAICCDGYEDLALLDAQISALVGA